MAKVKLVPGEWGALSVVNTLTPSQIEEKTSQLLDEMTLDEKIHQMSGDTPYLTGGFEMLRAYNTDPLPAGENLRLGIPGIRFSDGPRGVVIYNSTCFPVSMGRGASWDVELEERIGDAIGVEARSQGANFFGGVCINLLRHPAWGRAQETYGEDPYHLGEMGAALVRGVQRHIMACVKHFACNSMENARFKVDVQADERTLREIYLPHFKRCVDEGVASIMSAYNKVNGEYCGHNTNLLRNILKNDWNFEGFVISDFIWGIRDTRAAIEGGLDIEMPFTKHYGRKLRKLVNRGEISEKPIDEAVSRILRQKIRFAQVGEPQLYCKESVVNAEHRALALEAAQKSIVLLKNSPDTAIGKPLLPFDFSHIQRIALIGELAAVANTGDRGSSDVRAPYVINALEGLRKACGEKAHIHYDDGKQVYSAVKIARKSDIVIIMVGYTHHEEGEYVPGILWTHEKGGDRNSLTLSMHDELLIQTMASINPNLCVIMVGGSAIITENWRKNVPAILMSWYSGMEGGHALADVLIGNVNPSAKLPCVFPKSEDQLPFFDRDANSIHYNYFHGYRLMDNQDEKPAFHFGFGLSYTNFQYQNLTINRETIKTDESLKISIEVLNTGDLPGEEVIQLYIGYEGSNVQRPIRELKGFIKIHIQPGEKKRVTFKLLADQLAYYDSKEGWVVEPITYHIYVGRSSSEKDLFHSQFHIQE